MPHPHLRSAIPSTSACVRPISQRRLPTAVLLVLASAAGAPGASLGDLLAAVATNARFAPPARADVRIDCQPACTASRAILLGRDDALYVEVKDGLRTLVRPDRIVVADGGRPAEAPTGKPLADTAVLLEDLRVFTATSLRVPQISDESPDAVVVTGAPAGPSAWALLVLAIDPERRTIVRTQYYRESISNLAKIRRDRDFVQVGGRWRPGDVTFEGLRQGGTTHLTLSWRDAPEAPAALFEPSGLERPSDLAWP